MPRNNSEARAFSEVVQENRDTRLEEILVGATRLFNRQGFTNTTMEQVAEEVELVPGALYHYFKNKSDLAYLCFRRGCEIRASQLSEAQEPGIDGLERLRRFFRGLLRYGQSRMILFNELHSLPKAQERKILKMIEANKASLKGVLEDGMADGSIVESDPELTARAILSIVDFLSMWFTVRDGYTHRSVANAVDDILTHGIWRRDRPMPDFPAPDESLLPVPPDPGKTGDARREKVLAAAMELFNKHGYSGTSINAVARHLGVTRGGVYHYFKDKEELLFECLLRAHRINEYSLQARQSDEYLHWEVWSRRNLFYLHTTSAGPLVTYPALMSIGEERRREITRYTDALYERAYKRISEAIKLEMIRPLDIYTTVKIRGSTFSSFPIWYDPQGPYTPLDVADNHTRLLLSGLKPRPL